MDFSCITMQPIVYYPDNVPSSVAYSGITSLWSLLSLAYATRLKNWVFAKGVGIYTFQGGTPSIWEPWAPSLPPGGAGGIPGWGAIGSGVSGLHWSSWGAPLPLHLHCFCSLFAVPFLQGRRLSISFSQTIARSLSIAAFTFRWPGNSNPCFLLRRLWRKVAWSGIAFPL